MNTSGIKLLLVFLLLLLCPLTFAESPVKQNFKLADMTGKQHQLTDYKGKWVLVNYWATWCSPCLDEIPDLVSLYHQRKEKDLVILSVVFDYEDTQTVKNFADNMHMTYPIVLGDDSVVTQIGEASTLPSTYFYNPKGELVKIKRGLVTKQAVEKIIGVTK